MYRRATSTSTSTGWLGRFGIRGLGQVRRDLAEMFTRTTTPGSVAISLSSAGMLRPELSLPAYLGLVRRDRVSPIFNLFDRVGGGRDYRGVATRLTMRDYRGGRLSYDEHDGVDFVVPPGTPLVAAAPGILVAYRDTWLRGGLTACVDHGDGVVTQYTHLSKRVAEPGQRLGRGDVVGLSGHSGIDMTTFFPWVPPHLHFSVWLRGIPIDPYLEDGESRRAGTWLQRNDPRPSGSLESDEGPETIGAIEVNPRALGDVIAQCRSTRLVEELNAASSDVARVAIVEDSLHHQRSAWPGGIDAGTLRPAGDAARVRLTLPLRADEFDRAAPADTWFTRP